MFLFYSLMCRNYQKIQKETLLESNWDFLEICPTSLFNWSRFGPKTTSNGEHIFCKSVGNFLLINLDVTFGPFGVRKLWESPFYSSPRWDDGNPRSYIKGGNLIRGGLLHPRISSHQSHAFASPMDPISMGRAPKKPWRREAKGRRSPMMPAAGKDSPRRRRPALLAALSAVFTAISITNSSLYSVIHPPTDLCTVLCKHGVWCYNIYHMIYVMFP